MLKNATISNSKARDEMTDEEFNKIMAIGLAQAKSDESEEMDVIFDQLLSNIVTSEEESKEVQEAIEAIAIQLEAAKDENREKLYNLLEKKLLSLSDNLNSTGIRGMIAMRIMQIQAERNGLSDMSLEEINAEIDAVRRSR